MVSPLSFLSTPNPHRLASKVAREDEHQLVTGNQIERRDRF